MTSKLLQPQAYNHIWEALKRRFGGAREAMRRFDSIRQDESETIPDFEQALRALHREAWPNATPEQRDAALKRRFEDGLALSEMVHFLRLHDRDLEFHATVVKARQFADQRVRVTVKRRSVSSTPVRRVRLSLSGNPSYRASNI